MKHSFIVLSFLLCAIMILPACSKTQVQDMKNEAFIIDCDPGSGDAVALMLAKANLDDSIKLLVSSYGSSPISSTTGNLAQLAQLYDIDADLLQGAEKPNESATMTDNNEGMNGIAKTQLPQSKHKIIRDDTSEIIYKTLKKNKSVNYIILGPLTNIANVLIKYPDATDYIKRVIVVGGEIQGNKTEFNIKRDPISAKFVFDSNLSITMLPLTVTESLELTPGERLTLITEDGENVDYIRNLLNDNESNSVNQGYKGAMLGEVAVFAYLNHPNLAQTEQIGVTVITYGDEYGKTVKSDEKSNVTIITRLDKTGFIEEIKKAYNTLYANQ